MDRRLFIQALTTSATGYCLSVSSTNAKPFSSVNVRSKAKGSFLDSVKKQEDKSSVKTDSQFLQKRKIKCDVLVAGGGLAGISAALASARAGKKTVLIQDRSRLGGNASSEIRMHPMGVNPKKTGWREGGIIEELKLENAARNPQLSWDMWDFILYDKCISQKNLILLLDTTVCSASVDNKKITTVDAVCYQNRIYYNVSAKMYVDATGDANLATFAGCTLLSGRESPEKFGESLAEYDLPNGRQGSSILFMSREHDTPMPFIAPKWARKINESDLKFRPIRKNDLDYGYWWIELGGDSDAIRNTERLRFELLSVVMGVWDYIKNSGKYPEAKNRAIEFIGMIPGRRDTFRIEGEHIMRQSDIEGGWKNFNDSVAVGGWSMDDHPSKGFNAKSDKPCRQIYNGMTSYNIPLGSLFSKDIKNLFMAGRNISCSHVAFSSTRVMATCATIGQAVGTAAAQCVDENITPSQLRASKSRIEKLQQTLLRDGQTILNLKNNDSNDLALKASVSASESINGTKPANIIDGICIDKPDEFFHKWEAFVANTPSITLKWEKPTKISKIRLQFNSGNVRLAQYSRLGDMNGMPRQAVPEITKDYIVSARLSNGQEKILAKVKDNWQKLNEITFDEISAQSITIKITATNGSPIASIYEIRAEA